MPPKRSRSRSASAKRKPSRSRSSTPKRAPASRAKAAAAAESELQPLTTSYEWGGPLGAACMVLLLPLLILTLTALVRSPEGKILKGVRVLPQLVAEVLTEARAHLLPLLVIELGWLAAHAVFSVLPVGRVVRGTVLRNGERLPYRLNAIHAFVLSHGLIAALQYRGTINIVYLAERVPSLMLGSMIISAVMSVLLLLASHRSSKVLTALGGNTPSTLYNFWIGRELNPRTGPLDWKMMCELRPGLIGWSVLNWALVLQAVQRGTYTHSIGAIALLQSAYVFDGLLLEAGNLTMMDIVSDGFGYMLCFGDLTWVPFIYTLQAQFLVRHPCRMPPYCLAGCVAVSLGGYTLFRLANSQKDRFRNDPTDPSVAHLRTLKTARGTALLVSGYWGVCRRPNYVGDWLLALGWALCAGPAPIAYFHPVYFGILLIHRQIRDEGNMLEKYGAKDWNAFCKLVPYRLIPYVY